MSDQTIEKKNIRFWNELCGSQLARELGVVDAKEDSLHRFDEWYLAFYPYLENYIPYDDMRGERVLEVGLGYGTIGQRIAAVGAEYTGLDVAWGPVVMMQYRLHLHDLAGRVVQGSILASPFVDGSFDWLLAIGCFQHTGDMQRALDESWRLLREGGTAIVMVYNAYAYRRWLRSFPEAWQYWIWDKLGIGRPATVTSEERAQYDRNREGIPPPETVFVSGTQMHRLAQRWSALSVHRENIASEAPFRCLTRNNACRIFGPFLGLDLYCVLQK